jgi:hypothetical protein
MAPIVGVVPEPVMYTSIPEYAGVFDELPQPVPVPQHDASDGAVVAMVSV